MALDLEYALSLVIYVNNEVEENRRVPVVSDSLISFLVRMRDRYPVDERAVKHWIQLMDQAIR